MELLSIARILLAHRVLLLAGLIGAFGIGIAIGSGALPAPGAEPERATGEARARVLVDTRHSLVNDVTATADAIGAQAALLSDLLATDPGVRRIARKAGVPARTLVVLRPGQTLPTKIGPLADAASSLANTPAPDTLNVWTSTALPEVTFDAVAGDARTAARIVQAATATLRSIAARRSVGPTHEVAIRPLEPIRAITVPPAGGHQGLIAVGLTLFLAALWCGGIVVAAGVARAWRSGPATAARGTA
jgi:hypothetical protein